MHIVPLPLTGAGAQFAPVPDRAVRSADDPRLFTGHLWMMGAGAWQVRVTVDGDRGEGTLSVPVPTLPQATLAMSPALRALLFVLHAAARRRLRRHRVGDGARSEARRGRGARCRARAAAAGSPARSRPCVVVGVVFLGNMWWTVEATAYDRYVYKPLVATPRSTPDGRSR